MNTSIVLTGTIIPNTNLVAHTNPQKRKEEYLKAIHFYRQFAPVYFLENSSYNLFNDQDFLDIQNVFIRQFSPSKFVYKGKGFQEFEMLDKWLDTEVNLPQKWLKITGRYIYYNFNNIFDKCGTNNSYKIIIDQCKFLNLARTSIFCVNTEYYKQNIAGLYKLCDDTTGQWIERVLYKKLLSLPKKDFQIFSEHPYFIGISGTTGSSHQKYTRIHKLKSFARKINYYFDKKYIWYSLRG